MAHARLSALALLAIAACGEANADAPPTVIPPTEPPTSGLKMPAGWQELPALAQATRAALKDPAEVDGAEAWGDPSLGCYAVWWSVRGLGTAPAIADRLIAGLGGDVAITATDVKAPVADPKHPPKPTDTAWLELAFERKAKPDLDVVSGAAVLPLEGPPSNYRGKLRAKLGGGHVVVLACFANEREPSACDAPCTALLAGLP